MEIKTKKISTDLTTENKIKQLNENLNRIYENKNGRRFYKDNTLARALSL